MNSNIEKIFKLDSIEKIASDFVFLEGPIWDQNQNRLIFSDIRGNCMYQWTSKEGVRTYRKPSNKANGNAMDSNGNLITCEHATSRIVQERSPHQVEVIADKYGDLALNSPNDVILRSDGMIYFSDPSIGRGAKYGIERAQELDFQGVFRITPESHEVILLANDFDTPNGLCFSLDESHLYVNDTPKMLVRIYDVLPNGDLENRKEWVKVSGEGEGKPDGMKVDSADNLYTSGPGGIHVFDTNANFIGVIPVPQKVANFNWGGEDYCDLFITAQDSLYKIRTSVPGIRGR